MRRVIGRSWPGGLLAYGFLAAALLSIAPDALAKCGVARGLVAQDVQMDMGQVVIAPELPIGAVIKRIEVPINERENAIYCEPLSFSVARGRFEQAEQATGSTTFDNVYPTKVEGVGIRVFRQGSTVATFYPHDFELINWSWFSTKRWRLDGGQFIVELVKTAANTGSGSIANNGPFTTYYVAEEPGRPVLTSTFKGRGTTIVYPTCKVDAGSKNIVVNFGQVPSSRFSGPGTRADARDFSIRLTCQGSNVEGQQNDIAVRLDSSSALASQPGVIAIDGGADAATRIGVEVVRVDGAAETPVSFGHGLPLGRTQPGNQTFELPLRARYIQTASGPVGPGKANARATFTIEYD
ncbi:fimbrial protein [Novilysobacter spongiicola]|uniref:Pilin (Type 1 fimbria component protein) n=1 Tax=Lysobacter spongiicola DSM 21749 TaxID=1122188 RepID=A0A1T4RVE9_9GAMM|nr:fimbrial protein [Lysobacter spongiicola]SKA19969.1 Pilin (type 1 fimbria component protein) [Lysobacter spongiicola DSM 21749]